MATGRRTAKNPRKKASSSGKRATRTSSNGGFLVAVERVAAAVSREVVGVSLLALGLFFTAAFITGKGAFLGDVGLVAVTQLLGIVGVSLAPFAALAGALILVGRMPGRRVVGAGVLLLAIATSFAAALPERHRFDPESYTESGGVLGSGIYAAASSAGGFVGAALAVILLYAIGLSLLTSVSFRSILLGVKSLGESLISRVRGNADKDERQPRASRNEKAVPSRQEAKKGDETGQVAHRDSAEFEVVLPRRRESEDLPPLQDRVMGEYTPPPLSLLKLGGGDPEHDAEGTSRRLTQALSELGVEAQVVRAVVGPRVTRYELRLGSGVKVGKVRNLQQDIAYALAATEVRILAPIPGKSAVGVEVPNTRAVTVTLGDVFQEYPGANDWALPVGLGKDISGRAVFLDLAEMPHLLVAGTTGAGKSVMLNSLLSSLLLTTDPRRVKLVLVDPKRVELSQFGRIPHLITPVVTDVKKAANALSWAVAEMERRYEVLEQHGVRSLDGYNERAEKPMPYVVVVIDELADLMMAAAAKVEDAVIRLAQKARAVGIHLVVATQRPSVDVITGMIKANIPSRIAFAVSSQVDSRVILDGPGAEALLGKGDMLYKPVTAMRPSRVQGAFISEPELERIVLASTDGAQARYVEDVTRPRENPKATEEEPEDELLREAAGFVVSTQQASVSAVQRRFRVGYSRAGRIIDALERRGVVGPYEGSKSRAVVATELELGRIFGEEADPAHDSNEDVEAENKPDESW